MMTFSPMNRNKNTDAQSFFTSDCESRHHKKQSDNARFIRILQNKTHNQFSFNGKRCSSDTSHLTIQHDNDMAKIFAATPIKNLYDIVVGELGGAKHEWGDTGTLKGSLRGIESFTESAVGGKRISNVSSKNFVSKTLSGTH